MAGRYGSPIWICWNHQAIPTGHSFMSTYRVFLGAPPIHDIDNDPTNYQWKTISSEASMLPPLPEILPTQAFDDASRRISLVYQNVIFNDSFDENDGSLGEKDNDSNDILGGAGAFFLSFFIVCWSALLPRSDNCYNLVAHTTRKSSTNIIRRAISTKHE